MTIQMIAKDLYTLIKQVEHLENKLENTPIYKKEIIKNKLRIAIAERNQVRRLLDGRKG